MEKIGLTLICYSEYVFNMYLHMFMYIHNAIFTGIHGCHNFYGESLQKQAPAQRSKSSFWVLSGFPRVVGARVCPGLCVFRVFPALSHIFPGVCRVFPGWRFFFSPALGGFPRVFPVFSRGFPGSSVFPVVSQSFPGFPRVLPAFPSVVPVF